MVLLPLVIPLWGKIVLFSLAKKFTVVAAARLYGFPRLYRKSQQTVRYFCQDPQSRDLWGGRVRTLWRIPDNVLARWHNKAVTAAGAPHAKLPSNRADTLTGVRPALATDGSSAVSQTVRSTSPTQPACSSRPEFDSAPQLGQHHEQLQHLQQEQKQRAAMRSQGPSKIAQRFSSLHPVRNLRRHMGMTSDWMFSRQR